MYIIHGQGLYVSSMFMQECVQMWAWWKNLKRDLKRLKQIVTKLKAIFLPKFVNLFHFQNDSQKFTGLMLIWHILLGSGH